MKRSILACWLILTLGLLTGATQQPAVRQVVNGTGSNSGYYGATGSVISPSTGQTLDASTVLTRKDKVTAVSTNTTLGVHNVVFATIGAGGITLTLPAASSTTIGSYRLIIADTGVGNLTLAPNGSDKINGVNSSVTKTGQYNGFEALWISASDGWYVRALSAASGTGGTVTSIATTSPITGGTITGAGTIACATCAVTGSTLAQFAATSSAQLAGVISDETGTLKAVFSDSPVFTTTITVGAGTSQSSPLIGVRASINALEWGHNVGGNGSTLGYYSGLANPYICLNCEAGTNANTFRTRGVAGAIILSDLSGGLQIGNAPTTTADNQSFVELLKINATGTLHIGSVASQTLTPALTVRSDYNSFEFGHTNTGGYVSTLGTEVGTGNTFLCFHCSASVTSNLYHTLGKKGMMLRSIASATVPQLTFSVVDNANADFQTPTDRVWINDIEKLIVIPTATQTIAATNTITADACGGIKRVTAAGAVTTSTTNTFTAPAAANTGCIMDVCNVGVTNTITLDHNALFFTLAAGDLALAANTCVRVGSDGTQWRQLTGLLTGT